MTPLHALVPAGDDGDDDDDDAVRWQQHWRFMVLVFDDGDQWCWCVMMMMMMIFEEAIYVCVQNTKDMFMLQNILCNTFVYTGPNSYFMRQNYKNIIIQICITGCFFLIF